MEADLTNIKDQPLVYVSGYIASRLLKKSTCTKCNECLTVNDPAGDANYEYIRLREWWQDKKSLTYPSTSLCQMVDKAINIFELLKLL